MGDLTPTLERSYGCTFACGNPYDYVFIDVRGGTTEFLCLPCFVRLAADMVAAVTDGGSGQLAVWLEAADGQIAAPVADSTVKPRGHNAPATNDDPDLFAAYDSVITADELPEAFR